MQRTETNVTALYGQVAFSPLVALLGPLGGSAVEKVGRIWLR